MTTCNEDATTIGIRISKQEYEQIERFWRVNVYNSRSDFVQKAIRNMMEGVQCAHCGAVNPKGSHLCGVCLRPLSENDDMTTLLLLVAKNNELLKEFEMKQWD